VDLARARHPVTGLASPHHKEKTMRIPARFAPLLFSAILSAVMVAIVSGFVLFTSQGMHPDLLAQWARSGVRTWPIAFPTVFVVAPLVRRAVARLTAPTPATGAPAGTPPTH
jgi:hypothetical protein